MWGRLSDRKEVMKRTLLAVLMLGVLGQAEAATLAEVYQAASQRDATLQSAQAAYRAATEKIPQARAALRPQVKFTDSLAYTRTQSTISFPGFPSTFAGTANQATLSLVQPLYHRDSQIQVNEAKVTVDQAQAQLDTARQDLMLRTVQAYFNVLLAQDALTALAAQKAAVSLQLAAARRTFEVGSSTITDVNEAQARLDQVLSQQVSGQNQLAIARRALASLTGNRYDRLNGLGRGNGDLGLLDAGIDYWSEQALAQSRRIKIQQDAASAASLEVARNRAQWLPRVDLVATDTHNNGQLSPLTPTRTDAIGIQFSMPIYEGGLISSTTREAEDNRYKILDDLEQARRDVRLQTQQAYLNAQSARAQVAALEGAARSAQTNLRSTQLAKSVGIRTTVDVLNAQQAYYQAEKNLADARYNFVVSEFRLLASAGVISAAELQYASQRLRQPVNVQPPVSVS